MGRSPLSPRPRAGQLSPRQRDRVDAIHAMRQRGTRWTLIAFIIFIPALFGVGLFNEVRVAGRAALQTSLPVLGLLGGIFVIILGLSAFSQVLVSADARQQRITVAEGKAHVINVPSNWQRRYSRYELHLRRRGLNRTVIRFTTAHSLRYFREGRHYRLYYIPYYPLPIPLSAEEVESVG